jgi:hypothetical protein
MYWVAVLFDRLSRDWKVLSREQAQQSPYFGFRGWLLLLYLLTLVAIIQSLVWVFSPPTQGDLDVFSGNPDIRRGFDIVTVVVWAPFLILAPLKHPLTPKVWIGANWITVIISAAISDWSSQINVTIAMTAIGIVIAVLLTWYVLHSKRVNVTYLHRVISGGETTKTQPAFTGDAWRSYRIGWIVCGLAGVIVALGMVGFLGKLLDGR